MSDPGADPGATPGTDPARSRRRRRTRTSRRAPRLAVPLQRPPGLLRIAHGGYRAARRLIVGIAGIAVIAVGLLMTVTPGPAIVVIPIGLGILALEFVWARRLLRLFRVRARQAQRAYRRGDRHFWKRWLGRRTDR